MFWKRKRTPKPLNEEWAEYQQVLESRSSGPCTKDGGYCIECVKSAYVLGVTVALNIMHHAAETNGPQLEALMNDVDVWILQKRGIGELVQAVEVMIEKIESEKRAANARNN